MDFFWRTAACACLTVSVAWAADRVIPVYPGAVVIDSKEQAETEKKIRQQAVDDARARARESALPEGAAPVDGGGKKPEPLRPEERAPRLPEADPAAKFLPTPPEH